MDNHAIHNPLPPLVVLVLVAVLGSVNPSVPVVADITKIQEVAEAYKLPTEVSVRLTDGSTVNRAVVWSVPEGVVIEEGEVTITQPGVYNFTGTVEGVKERSKLKLDVRLPLKLVIDQEIQASSLRKQEKPRRYLLPQSQSRK